jgi:hypothetical protein
MDRFEASLQSRAHRSQHQDLEMAHNEEPAIANDRSRAVHPSSYYPVPSAILLGRDFLEPPPTRLNPQDESMLSYDMLELYEVNHSVFDIIRLKTPMITDLISLKVTLTH